jgi:hypothetical protein
LTGRKAAAITHGFDSVETFVAFAGIAGFALTCINGRGRSHATLPSAMTMQRALMRIHRAPKLNAE